MPVDDQVTGTSRWSVLREVKTPLTFFALAIIIVEGILFSVAQRADGLNLTLIISGTIALLFTLTGVVSYLTFKSAKDLTSGGALTVASEVTPVRHLTAYIIADQADESSELSLTILANLFLRNIGWQPPREPRRPTWRMRAT